MIVVNRIPEGEIPTNITEFLNVTAQNDTNENDSIINDNNT